MKSYATRISVLYFLMASLWIFLSDWVVEELVPIEHFSTIQSIKGFAFITISAFVLYFLSKHYYKRIRKNESDYRQLFEDNPHPMWVYNAETLKFLTVNDAAVEKYGYSKDEFKQMSITDIRPEEDKASILMFVERLVSKVYHDSGIWRHKNKNGKIFFVRIASHSTRFGRNKNARVVLAIDVDEQVQSQKKIIMSEAKLKGLINNSDDLIWMVDGKGIVVTANEAFQSKFRQFLGFDIELSKKIDVNQLPNTGLTENWSNYIKQAFQGEHFKIEQEVKKDNVIEYFEIIINPIYNDNNEIFGVGCFARDVTQRKLTENRIKDQVTRLKEVAWIQSHEVRKPLANILGLIGLLKISPDNKEETAALLNHMQSSCNELDAVIKKVVKKSTSENDSTT